MESFDEKLKFLFGLLSSFVFMLCTTLISIVLLKLEILSPVLFNQRIFNAHMNWKVFLFIPLGSLVTYTIAHFFHRVIILNYATKQSELEVIRLRSINIETTNRLLKQQIQPHFLFNALNTLKSLIKKQPTVAETYLIQLSEFLRTSFTSHKTDLISVKEELKLCDTYMNMQKIRFGDALIYRTEIPEKYMDKYSLPFFSVQPLLENAIKHNEMTALNPLHIDVFIDGNDMVIKNNLRLKRNVEASTNNGLTNLRERYQILHNEEIEIQQSIHEFIVRLKLIPNEHSHH